MTELDPTLQSLGDRIERAAGGGVHHQERHQRHGQDGRDEPEQPGENVLEQLGSSGRPATRVGRQRVRLLSWQPAGGVKELRGG